MSFFSRWFRKSEPEDYEQILASLALDIQKRQTRLSEIRLRERRTTLLVTLYALALWGAYVSLWYTGLVPNISGHRRNSRFEKGVRGLPVIVGPIIILFTRRIVQLWYTRIGDAEEKTLKKLYKDQRTKIEDIKKKTNYYTTRNLIERYDDGSAADSPLRRRATPAPQQPPVTPQRPSPQQRPMPNKLQTPLAPGLQNHLSPMPQQPMPTPRKQWYDKVADALLGDDESSTTAAASRYALICQKCFTHNGLVKESMWEDAQYICLKCGHFNPSARSLKQGGASPQSPTSPLPQPQAAQSHSPSTAVGRKPSPLRHSASPERSDASDGRGVVDANVAEGSSMRMDVDS